MLLTTLQGFLSTGYGEQNFLLNHIRAWRLLCLANRNHLNILLFTRPKGCLYGIRFQFAEQLQRRISLKFLTDDGPATHSCQFDFEPLVQVSQNFLNRKNWRNYLLEGTAEIFHFVVSVNKHAFKHLRKLHNFNQHCISNQIVNQEINLGYMPHSYFVQLLILRADDSRIIPMLTLLIYVLSESFANHIL